MMFSTNNTMLFFGKLSQKYVKSMMFSTSGFLANRFLMSQKYVKSMMFSTNKQIKGLEKEVSEVC